MMRPFARTPVAILALLCAMGSRGALAQSQPDDATESTPAARDAVDETGPPENSPNAGADGAPDTSAEESRIDAAREHIARGEELYISEDWDGALAEFQRAYELLADHPAQYLITYNLGRCHEHLFQYERAMTYYRAYLEVAGPDAEDRAEVQAKVDLFQQLLATIYLDVNIPEYEVWVDERRIGTNLIEIMVPGGSHLVEVRAEGFVANQQDVQIAAQSERTLVFELDRLAEEYRGINQGYFWASSALAVATLAVGVVVGIMVVNEGERLSTQATDPVAGLTIVQADEDHVADLALTADLLYGTAGLFAVAAIVLAFLTDWDGEESGRDESEGAGSASIRFVVGGPGLTGFGLRGSF